MSTSDAAATANAKALLERLRRTPMARGGRLNGGKRTRCAQIARAIEGRAVWPRLAARIALQLVIKFEEADLGTPSTWRAIGDLVRSDVERLQRDLGLVERQIVVALPKLSGEQIAALLKQLGAVDPTIARTVLNVALDAAEPVAAASRYMDQFHRVAEQLTRIDPGIARTIADATFMARIPVRSAITLFKRFAEVMTKIQADVPFARTVARAACRAPHPLKAAERFIGDYEKVVDILTAGGVESSIARSLAGIASMGAAPLPTAHKLLENFEAVLKLVSATHPSVARSIALSACRSTDPRGIARQYADNYDAIVRVVSRTDPRRAHMVAAQAFRSHHPLRWAKRYLKECQADQQ